VCVGGGGFAGAATSAAPVAGGLWAPDLPADRLAELRLPHAAADVATTSARMTSRARPTSALLADVVVDERDVTARRSALTATIVGEAAAARRRWPKGVDHLSGGHRASSTPSRPVDLGRRVGSTIGAVRPEPACAADALRIAEGFQPHGRQVAVNGRPANYGDVRGHFGPWAGGYFNGFGGRGLLSTLRVLLPAKHHETEEQSALTDPLWDRRALQVDLT